MKVGIIGLGLMGGSLARDLSKAGHQVLGFDADTTQLEQAVRDSQVQPLSADLSGLESCDVVVLAAPIGATIELLERVAARCRGARLITDVASTKRSIVAAAERLQLSNFVGSHPLAGDHRSGWQASVRGLFADARVFLCRTRFSQEDALATAQEFWQQVGATPEVTSAEAHDQLLAFTSHLPQILSTTLGLTLHEQGITRAALGPGGRDMTRLAGSDPALWQSIVRDNAEHVLAALSAFARQVEQMRAAIVNDDAQAVLLHLTGANRWSSAPTS